MCELKLEALGENAKFGMVRIRCKYFAVLTLKILTATLLNLFFGKTFMGNKNSDDAIPVEYVRKNPHTKVIVETKNFNK
jgi:hypothetical protein